jgi:multidrug resistance protein MdtO
MQKNVAMGSPCCQRLCHSGGWVTTGSQRISYAGLQIAFAFFYSVFQGYAPDTDLDNVRNRMVGILFGLLVTAFVFKYIWPERARIERE